MRDISLQDQRGSNMHDDVAVANEGNLPNIVIEVVRFLRYHFYTPSWWNI